MEPLLLDFIARGEPSRSKSTESSFSHSVGLLDYVEPAHLGDKLGLDLPYQGRGREGLLSVVHKILDSSANTWHQGFMDKLYASTNAVGLVAELILATLNTNVSPPPCATNAAHR